MERDLSQPAFSPGKGQTVAEFETFLFALERPLIEAGILAAAGLTDVLDGWVARRNQQVTATGAVVDPITDKLFVLTVVLALVVTERLPLWAVGVLSTREIGEAPLVVWWTFSRARRRRRASTPMANVPGKLATVLQFAAVLSALDPSPLRDGLVIVAGVAGLGAAASYWWRDLASGGRGNQRGR